MDPIRANARNLLDARYNLTGWGFGPRDVDHVATAISHETTECEAARNALRVLVFSDATRAWLIEHDRKALEQAMSALPELTGVPIERLRRTTTPA